MTKQKTLVPPLITPDGEVISDGGFKWKTPYNHNTEYEALVSGTVNNEPSMTQQSQAEDADINTIVRRFGLAAKMKDIPMPPSIDQFDDVGDLQTAMNLVNAAKQSFMQLPPDVRDTFNGNPVNFVAYVDAALAAGDLDKLREWGLAVPAATAPPAPPATPPAPPTPPTPTPETPK